MTLKKIGFLVAASILMTFPTKVNAIETGIVSGTITDNEGSPATNVCILAYKANGSSTGYKSLSQNNGQYAIYLPEGEYKFFFKTDGWQCGYGKYQPEWFNDKTDVNEADIVSISTTQNSQVDAVLENNGKIYGKVTKIGGFPLENVCVDLYQDKYIPGNDYQQYLVGTAPTDTQGNYQFTKLPANTYKLHFRDCDPTSYRVVPQWYNGANSYHTAEVIGVVYNGGAAHRKIDTQLQLDSVIKGTVTNTSGEVVSGICVDAYDSSSSTIKYAESVTDAQGNYALPGLESGVWSYYSLQYYDCNPQKSYLAGRKYGLRLAQAGVHVVWDIEMLRQSTVSGKVTDLNGNPLPFIDVSVKGNYNYSRSARTDINGEYTITGIHPSRNTNDLYQVTFCSYNCNYNKYVYPETFYFPSDNQHQQGVNAVLYKPATVYGIVKSLQQDYLSGIRVSYYQDNVYLGAAYSYNGSFALRDLKPGNYTLHFSDEGQGHSWYGNYREPNTYQDHWYDRKNSQQRASILTINEGDRKSIEITMLPWGEYFTTPITIDIKPKDNENVVSCTNPKGLIPVAVITTDKFDATTVNEKTLEFGPEKATIAHPESRHIEDVNSDGRNDLMLHFRFEDTGLSCDHSQAELYGQTLTGEDLEGIDTITITTPLTGLFSRFRSFFSR